MITASIPASAEDSIRDYRLHWKVTHDGLKCLGFGLTGIGLAIVSVIVGSLTTNQFASLAFLSGPLVFLGLGLGILGSLLMMVGLLQCCVVPEKFSRALILVGMALTIYSYHLSVSRAVYHYSTNPLINQTRRGFSENQQPRYQEMIDSFQLSQRANTVVAYASNVAIVVFFLSLACFFGQRVLVSDIQKYFVFQIAGLMLLIVMIFSLAYIERTWGGETVFWSAFISGVFLLSFFVASFYLMVRMVFICASTIKTALDKLPPEQPA